MKESVTKFNLEAAFKALDEIEIPVARKGIAANKVNLKETFNRKSKLDLLEQIEEIENNKKMKVLILVLITISILKTSNPVSMMLLSAQRVTNIK